MKLQNEIENKLKVFDSNTTIDLLLICGIVAPIIYICSDIYAAIILYPGYSYTSMQVSELSAVGSPTRSFWIAISIIWAILTVGYSFGVILVNKSKLLLQISGFIILFYGIIGLLWVIYAPMQMRGTIALENDIMHIVFAVIQVLNMVLFISFGSTVKNKRFRIYSITTIIVMLAFGALTGTTASAIAEGKPTPWMGIIERVSVYSPIIWTLSYALFLLKRSGYGIIKK